MDYNMSYTKSPTNIPLRSSTFGDLINEAKIKYNDKIFLLSRSLNRSFTFGEIIEEAENLALGLTQIGLQFEDKVGIIVRNSPEAFVINLACALGGFIAVNLFPVLQYRELEYCIKNIQINCIITVDKYKTSNMVELLKNIVTEISYTENGIIKSKNAPSIKSIVLISDVHIKDTINYQIVKSIGKQISKDYINNMQKNINCHDLSTIIYTSGTTGNPKAVGLTHYQMYNSCNIFYLNLGLKEENNKYCFCLPLFHVLGQVYMYISLLSGSTFVLPSNYYNSEENLKAISEERCTFLMGTPAMFADLIKIQKEKSLPLYANKVMTGSFLSSNKTLEEIKEVLGVKNISIAYGCSETIAVTLNWFDCNEKPSSSIIGKCLENLEIKVVDKDDSIVAIGTVGNLCVRGFSVTTGYLGISNSPEFQEDGWYKTGDAVFLDKDGKVHIVGRLKEIINRGGEKVCPKEIEQILEVHPNIVEVAVVGTYHERLGEEVCACLRIKPNSSITLDEVKNFCIEKLSYYKIPTKMCIVKNFPKSNLGKLQRIKLLELINKNM